MIEFVQAYWLWIVLAGVFVAMNWFGMGCCGGGHHGSPTGNPGGNPDESPNGKKTGAAGPKSSGSCH